MFSTIKLSKFTNILTRKLREKNDGWNDCFGKNNCAGKWGESTNR